MNYSKNTKKNPQLSVYYWLLHHFMLPKHCKENSEYAKDGYAEIDSPFKLVNKDFKYYKFNGKSQNFETHNIKVPIDLIANCMISNYPKGYRMLDELLKPYPADRDKQW